MFSNKLRWIVAFAITMSFSYAVKANAQNCAGQVGPERENCELLQAQRHQIQLLAKQVKATEEQNRILKETNKILNVQNSNLESQTNLTQSIAETAKQNVQAAQKQAESANRTANRVDTAAKYAGWIIVIKVLDGLFSDQEKYLKQIAEATKHLTPKAAEEGKSILPKSLNAMAVVAQPLVDMELRAQLGDAEKRELKNVEKACGSITADALLHGFPEVKLSDLKDQKCVSAVAGFQNAQKVATAGRLLAHVDVTNATNRREDNSRGVVSGKNSGDIPTNQAFSTE